MAKQYFRHDFYTRTSPDILNIRCKHGILGYGAYWALIEIMFEQNGVILQSSIPAIAYDLHCESDIILDILNNYNLFDFDNEKYTAVWVNEDLTKKNELIETLKKNGSKGGKSKAKNNKKDSKSIASVKQTASKDLANQLIKTKTIIKSNKFISSNELTNNVRSDGSIYYLEILNDRVNDLEKCDTDFYQDYGERLKSLFEKISYEPEIKNGNAILQTEQVLSDLINLFRGDLEFVTKLIANCFDIIDSTNVRNKFKYAISVFHNKARGV